MLSKARRFICLLASLFVQILFAFVDQEAVSVGTIATVNIAVVASLLAWLRFSGPQFYTPGLLPDIPTVLKYTAIFLAVLFALSPVLQTLTQSYCNDTIWAQTILLAAMHICFHNYRITTSASAVSGAFSFNAIMFAAALLASRLPSTTHVFIFVVLAIELFALYPLIRDYIRVRSEAAHLAATAAWVAATLALLTASSTLLAIVYALAIAFITFVAPLGLLKAQAYKNEITGPWDIAEVTQFST